MLNRRSLKFLWRNRSITLPFQWRKRCRMHLIRKQRLMDTVPNRRFLATPFSRMDQTG